MGSAVRTCNLNVVFIGDCYSSLVSVSVYFVLFYIRYGGGPSRFGGGNRGGPPQGKFGNPGERLRKKHWNLDELPKFQKNFYQEHADVTHRPLVRYLYSGYVLAKFSFCHSNCTLQLNLFWYHSDKEQDNMQYQVGFCVIQLFFSHLL